MKRLVFVFVIVSLGCKSTLLAQPGEQADNADAVKIIRDWKLFQYDNLQTRPIRLPQRKFDSPFFCDELIPFRNGFIINSIATSPGGRVIDVQTNFYYYDLATGRLSLLAIPGVDTIESVIAYGSSGLICSYKAKGKNVISRFAGKGEVKITATAPEAIKTGLDTARWVKLGYKGDSLFCLTPNAVYVYTQGQWEQRVRYSLSDFFLKRRYRRDPLPTRNILVTDSCIWFLQEVVQGRTCRLMRLDLQTGEITELFERLGYTDNYEKQLFDYMLLWDHSLLITANRLYGNFMVLNVLNGKTEVWTFNNKTRMQAEQEGAASTAPGVAAEDETAVGISALAVSGDTVYLAGINGVFRKYRDRITTVMRWNNSHQTVDKSIDFEFVPRCLEILPGNRFLVGGLYGGLYIADPAKSSVRWLDDAGYKRTNRIDLRNW